MSEELASWPLPEDAERTHLVGEQWLFQRKRGHRTSTDDVVVAARAVDLCGRAGEVPERYLDLGCGIGSVLLLTAHALRPAIALGLEAQEQSLALLFASLAELPAETRPRAHLADLREASSAEYGTFDLVTGSPPYFPLGTGVEPADAQRRACRFEVRGGAESYVAAGARLLSPHGRLVLVTQTAMESRVASAAVAAALPIVSRLDLFMRADRPAPFLTVFELRRAAVPIIVESLAIRDARGEITADYAALRSLLGLTSKG